MTTSDEPDVGLVARLVAGDALALAQLYDRHADAVFRVAFRRLGDRQLAEEVLQDTYLTLWNRAELFDPAAGSLIAWLSTIARNRAVDRHRARLRRSAFPLGLVRSSDDADHERPGRAPAVSTLLPPGTDGGADDPQRAVDQAERRAEIGAALADLPELEREVLRLAYYEELSQAEIATHLGWPLGTVKTRTRRALHRLRAALADMSGREDASPPHPPWGPGGTISSPELVPRDPGPATPGPGGPSTEPAPAAGRGVHDGPR